MDNPSFELTLKITVEGQPRTVKVESIFPNELADWKTIIKNIPALLTAQGYIIDKDLQFILENVSSDNAKELADKLDEILSEQE